MDSLTAPTQKQENTIQYNNGKYFPDEAWNKPVRLKASFDTFNDAKYGFLSFEGIGRTYTTFEVPNPGWYRVQCYGFVQSADNHDAYLFAKVEGSSETSSYGGESKKNLHTVPNNTFRNKNTRNTSIEVGKNLTLTNDTYNKEAYKTTLWICVTEEQFHPTDGSTPLRTLQVGVGKDEAKQSNRQNYDGGIYYYDTDWVCIDDIRVSYMGIGPAFFYEDEENLEYLRFDEDDIKQFQSAEPDGRYRGSSKSHQQRHASERLQRMDDTHHPHPAASKTDVFIFRRHR